MKTTSNLAASLLLILLVLIFAVPEVAIAYVPESYGAEMVAHAQPRTTLRMCPVDGETTFKDAWNARRSGGRRHKGVDMRAERNTPLVAVEDGIIVRQRYDRAGGKTIYVEGQSGTVYFYAHLNKYVNGQEVGDFVRAGATVGYVGRSGNADMYHLHFGYRPDGSTPENPYTLLVEACMGDRNDEPRKVLTLPNAVRPW